MATSTDPREIMLGLFQRYPLNLKVTLLWALKPFRRDHRAGWLPFREFCIWTRYRITNHMTGLRRLLITGRDGLPREIIRAFTTMMLYDPPWFSRGFSLSRQALWWQLQPQASPNALAERGTGTTGSHG